MVFREYLDRIKNFHLSYETRQTIGVSVVFTAIIVGGGTILSIHIDKRCKAKRDALVSKLAERADTNKNGRVDVTEIEDVYRVVDKSIYDGLTNRDIRLYLKRTDPNH